jgi:hypothetical protein
MNATRTPRRLRFRMSNALAAMTLVAFWLAIAENPPERPNALSQLGLLALPVAAAFALADRIWLGMLLGCLIAFLAPQP